MKQIIAIVSSLLLVAGCSTSPETRHPAASGKTKTIRISSLIAFFGVLIFSILNFGNLSRDKGKLGGIMEICEMLPEESVLSADPRFSKDWNLITYFVRYNHIALDFKDLDREYFLGTSETKLDTDYEVVYKKQGEQLLLFRKK